ncbi:MAG: hypothetical protein JJU06_17455 [Ectothiorhodospiraceae bacterium]|nr:hypothetical protein [Ectothiorhodospiraceae bacterium]MCH8502691.1 hypothetical protein [Ectothiorhodospiraceae bacterium]
MMRWLGLLVVLGLCSPGVLAHDIQYRVQAGQALVVELDFPYGDPPIYESYEVFRPEESVAFQVGRTDGLGRVTLVPDRPGDWRLRVTTDDGHGLELTLAVDAQAQLEEVHGPGLPRLAAVLAGVGYLLGLGGLLLFWRHRHRAGS